MDTDKITYCVPSTPCANIGCDRHKIHAPVNETGVSVANLWPTCPIKRAVPLPFPYTPILKVY